MNRIAILALAGLAPFALTACDKPAPSANAVPNAHREPVAWLLTDAPADAVTVADIKPTTTEGDTVVLRGRIGGRKEPINPGAGVFVVVDPSVPSCDQIPGDNCPTPWDYCCEPRESLVANSATVQLVDADGNSIQADLTAAGLKPLDEVVIVGTIAARPSEQVLIIRATAIHKVGG
jgi:hypothetical protein